MTDYDYHEKKSKKRLKMLINDNDSDRAYSSDNSGVLPKYKMPYEADEEDSGCAGKAKKNKWIILVVLLGIVVALVLAIVLHGESDKPPGPAPPGPVPPGPVPPVPPTPVYGYWNPYVIDTWYSDKQEKVYGSLKLDPNVKAENVIFKDDNKTLKADPRSIPTGVNNELAKEL